MEFREDHVIYQLNKREVKRGQVISRKLHLRSIDGTCPGAGVHKESKVGDETKDRGDAQGGKEKCFKIH